MRGSALPGATESTQTYLQTMSSSSPTTTSGSRSPSPRTPQSSPFAESAAFQADFDPTAAWFIAMHRPKSDTSLFVQPHKFDDEQMLQIDDLLEQHAFDEYAITSRNPLY